MFGGGIEGLKTALMLASLGGLIGSLFIFMGSKYYTDDCKKVEN